MWQILFLGEVTPKDQLPLSVSYYQFPPRKFQETIPLAFPFVSMAVAQMVQDLKYVVPMSKDGRSFWANPSQFLNVMWFLILELHWFHDSANVLNGINVNSYHFVMALQW